MSLVGLTIKQIFQQAVQTLLLWEILVLKQLQFTTSPHKKLPLLLGKREFGYKL